MADKKEPKFTKRQLVKSARYRNKIDLVNALLSGDKEYTLKQVDKAIDEYLKQEVR